MHVDPDDGIEIDLHRTLVLGPFGQWIDADELMTNLDTFVVGGRTLPRLDDTGMLLNVALHAALGWAHPRIAPIRDCYELAASASLDQRRLERWVSSWRLGAAFERARSLVATSWQSSRHPSLTSVAWRRVKSDGSWPTIRSRAAH